MTERPWTEYTPPADGVGPEGVSLATHEVELFCKSSGWGECVPSWLPDLKYRHRPRQSAGAAQPLWAPEYCPSCQCQSFCPVDGGGVRCLNCKDVFHAPEAKRIAELEAELLNEVEVSQSHAEAAAAYLKRATEAEAEVAQLKHEIATTGRALTAERKAHNETQQRVSDAMRMVRDYFSPQKTGKIEKLVLQNRGEVVFADFIIPDPPEVDPLVGMLTTAAGTSFGDDRWETFAKHLHGAAAKLGKVIKVEDRDNG